MHLEELVVEIKGPYSFLKHSGPEDLRNGKSLRTWNGLWRGENITNFLDRYNELSQKLNHYKQAIKLLVYQTLMKKSTCKYFWNRTLCRSIYIYLKSERGR